MLFFLFERFFLLIKILKYKLRDKRDLKKYDMNRLHHTKHLKSYTFTGVTKIKYNVIIYFPDEQSRESKSS